MEYAGRPMYQCRMRSQSVVESLGPGRAMRAVGLGGYLPVEAAKPATSGFQSTRAFKPLTSFESGTREQFACIKL
jgi:hypothetical protein